MSGHCRDCAYFKTSPGLGEPYGECDEGSEPLLIFPMGYSTEGIAVHPDYGCVQFEAKA